MRTPRPVPGACPACGEEALEIYMKLEASPIGSYSLAGTQMKFSAREWPYLRCTACKIEARGKRDGE